MTHDQIILLTVAAILLVLTIAVVVVSSRHAPEPVFRCAFCDADKHVHDVHSGLCINRDCRCEEGR